MIDLLITHAAQIATCASPTGPKRGADLADVGLLPPDTAVAIHDGRILALGPTADLSQQYPARQTINASGRALVPGFVDCHTHAVYAGDRIGEFEQKLQGANYLDILASGGGIASTARAVRQATAAQLAELAAPRLRDMLRLGTTTVEIKTGYGLDTASEMAMLEAITLLANNTPQDVIPTFLAAHALPPEYAGQAEAYVALVVGEMLPRAADWYAQSPFPSWGMPFFNDVFCEKNAFTLAQARAVLEAGLAHGLRPKIHADEFVNLGGVGLAIELGAVSADHLDVTSAEELAQLGTAETIAVLMPAVNFHLGSHHYAPARAMIEAGAAVALATDLNPGSAPCLSMPLVMGIACRYQKMLPSETLNASTINAAHALGLGERLGSLEVGKQADLLILDTADYRHLAYQLGGNLVQTVIKRGVVQK
jgi:imidazolonepropionase